MRSLLSLISYLGSGTYRERYLGVTIPPTNLQEHHLDQARAFADQLADEIVPPTGLMPERTYQQPSPTEETTPAG